MKIMIGVDDSPHSTAAIEFVKQQTWQKGTEVVIASAVRPAVIYSEIYVPAADEYQLALENATRFHEELVAKAKSQIDGSGLAVKTLVLQGDPRDQLVEAVRSERVDLLVVGSHGRTGLSRLLMGSVAAHLVAHAPCNVLVVRMDAPRR